MIETPPRPEPSDASPGPDVDVDPVDSRVGIAGRCALAGICLAASVPPWGWWPLAFVGIAILDRLIAEQPWRTRFRRTWLVSVAWLYPAMLWMFDLTAPGYVVAGAFYAAYFGLAAALTPPGPGRRLVLPGAIALAEAARWSWPFGGVPLANLALSQVNTPLAWSSRLGGSLLVVVLVVVAGQALAAAVAERAWRPAVIGLAALALFVVGGALHPRSDVVDEVDVALVQGGGAQQTRASVDQQPVVLARHLEASIAIDEPVDLVIWPENVVNPGRYLDREDAFEAVAGVAATLDAPVLAGWFFPVSDTATANFQSIINPDGTETDRYDKVRIVPFGEFVPLRGLIEAVAPNSGIPRRDVQIGTLDPVLDSPVGPVGVSISWEGFFDTRARAAAQAGAQILTNPTNGSSYWLTQVQTQQLASNQLRAIENDRWVLQVAPTGFSAVVDADGNVLQRTGISERAVLTGTVEMRQGRTLATVVGRWPVVLYGLAALAATQLMWRRRPSTAPPTPTTPPAPTT
ncbi:MAG: apolipoprotein N-acyltransferase [Actinomycetota bacterium]